MPELKPEELKQLLTASELKLVELSQPPEVSQLSEAKLRKNITLTRKARDKWRDQATRQRRDKQRSQGSRVTDAAARSADKNKVLTKALENFEKQLEKVTSGQTEPGKKAPAPKGPSKKKRAKGHRESRAAVRAELEEKRSRLEEGKSGTTTKKKAAKKTTAKKSATGKKKTATKKTSKKKAPAKKKPVKKATPKKATKKVAKKKAAATTATKDASSSTRTTKKAAKKKAAKKKPAYNPLTTGLAAKLNLNPGDQRARKTGVKQTRVQQSGLKTRTRGHVSARGKRSQARRDQRG